MQQVSGVFLSKEPMKKIHDLERDQGKYTDTQLDGDRRTGSAVLKENHEIVVD